MGFKFTFLCDLLSSLEENKILKAATHSRNRNLDARTVAQWFARRGKHLRDPETDQLALLSCMFPEKRTDRVYWLQDTGLARVIGRCLLLGSSRREELEKWRTSGGADLGQCVENVMRQAENHVTAGQEVTVEEVDTALTLIASRCRFSGPRVRRQRSAVDVEETLSPLYRRLSSRDAKWLTRMILKSHFSRTVPERLVLETFHFLLPHLLLFQNSFEAAVKLLSSEPIVHFPPRPETAYAKDLGKIALHHLSPEIGIKIGRPEYYKARSIKHCCTMAGQRRMSVERKYDGEYCQIHVDLSKTTSSIQIFSKSGKDSTSDRAGVHEAVRKSLKIGTDGCKFKTRCVLEGELVVWSDKHQNIMPFHKLRKLVSRSGAFIGTESDSPPQPYEHLMIVFFDMLILDNDICLRKPHRDRRLLLKDTVEVIAGHADLADQRVVDFSRADGHARLQAIFSMGIAERWEGFVLKGCEDPYFPILIGPGNCEGRWIKLKKDYIPGLGDTVDLALIGAAYNARDATALGLVKKESWTQFFVGCLENKDAVLRSDAEPRFRVIDVVDCHGMSQPNMQTLNKFGKFSARSTESELGIDIGDVRPGLPRIDVVFKTPFIVEMLGSGFEKPSGARYYTLRFPRILKIHTDRSLEDAVTFQELQLLAEAAVSVPSEDLLEQNAEWSRRVQSSTSKPGYIPDSSESFSTVSTPSPAKPIPIFVDRPTSSGSSSGGSPNIHENVLASNGNLSSQANARKRKASLSASKPYCQGTSKVQRNTQPKGADENATSEGSLATKDSLGRDQVRTDNGELSDELKGESEPTKSPLMTIPIYIPSGNTISQQTTPQCLSNIAQTLEEFLTKLRSAGINSDVPDAHAGIASQNDNFGIIFADCSLKPLGPVLLELTQQIFQALLTPTAKAQTRGRVFILAEAFIRLDLDWKRTRFCLRKTWERISEEFFYASISWNVDKETLLSTIEPADEIPSMPDNDCPGGSPTPTLTATSTASGHLRAVSNEKCMYRPRVRISFDRKDILVLGE
ncbi:hypothetical protein BDV18DRAFT_24860 [Aspergillus unguis]